MAVVAASTVCNSFNNCFESLQDWPELKETISSHGYNTNKSGYLENTVDFNDNNLSTALQGLEFLRFTYSCHDSKEVVDKNRTGNIFNVETKVFSEQSFISENPCPSHVSQSDKPSCEHAHLNTFSDIDDSPVKFHTAEEQTTKKLKGKRKNKRKQNNKVRIKSEKQWRTLDISEFGFHISRFPISFNSIINDGESIGEHLENKFDAVMDKCGPLQSTSAIKHADTSTLQNKEAMEDAVDSLLYFRNIGIDVTTESEEINVSQLPDPLYEAQDAYNGLKTFLSKPSKQDSFNLEIGDLFYPSVNTNSNRKKCNKFRLYDLECASSSRVYIRPDRHRRVQKAHKAVKSKNCESLYNNKGRKTLYMHHRLVKMHNIDFDFRHTLKSQRIPAMTTKHVDVLTAKQVCKALSTGNNNFLGDTAPPVQSLKHAIHETNTPIHLDMDLATFLITLQHRDLTPEDYDMLLRLDDSVKPKTVSTSILSRLKTEVVGPDGLDFDDDTLPMCTVCMEPYIAGQERKFLPCSHFFHSSCIDAWLKNSSMNCPLDGLPVENT